VISRVTITIAKQSGLNKSVNVILVVYGRFQLRETSLSWEDLNLQIIPAFNFT
jgi:hypothetical protein